MALGLLAAAIGAAGQIGSGLLTGNAFGNQADAAQQAAPGVQRVRCSEDQARCPVLCLREQQGLIVSATLYCLLKVAVECANGIVRRLDRLPQLQPGQVAEACAQGLVKDQSVRPHVGQGFSHVVKGVMPFFGHVPNEYPILISQPALNAAIELLVLLGPFNEIRGGELSRPVQVAFKRPDEDVVRRHEPVAPPAGVDIRKVTEEIGEEAGPDELEILRAGDFSRA